jgi:hypothetical protein
MSVPGRKQATEIQTAAKSAEISLKTPNQSKILPLFGHQKSKNQLRTGLL